MALQDDPVLRQRAGLVGAEDVHGPEVLDRIEALDDHLLARHRQGALGQVDRHDHRQHLGRQPDRDGHGERNASIQSPLVRPLMRKTSGHHDQHEADHQPGEAVDALVEAGQRPLGRRSRRRATQSRFARPCAPRRAVARAAHDVGAHEADVLELQRRSARRVRRGANFSTGIDSPVSAAWLTNRSLARAARGRPPGSCRPRTGARCRPAPHG